MYPALQNYKKKIVKLINQAYIEIIILKVHSYVHVIEI